MMRPAETITNLRIRAPLGTRILAIALAVLGWGSAIAFIVVGIVEW